MSGKIMIGVDSVMDRERVALDVVYENEEYKRVLAEVEREWGRMRLQECHVATPSATTKAAHST